MADKLTATSSTIINTTAERVWQAFTTPEMIKQYLFGTNVTTDWQKGSPITYKGEWEGKAYEDKGKIIDIEPGKRLHTTYWSSMSGTEDKPENYANVYYEIEPHDEKSVKVNIIQDNIDSEDQVKHMEQNWASVLKSMKDLLEKQA